MQLLFDAVGSATGSLVDDGLQDNMLITFNSNAPKDYLEYVLTLENISYEQHITPCLDDLWLRINNIDYQVTAMGHSAWDNLSRLGHITIFFDGKDIPAGYGSVHVKSAQTPSAEMVRGPFTLFRK